MIGKSTLCGSDRSQNAKCDQASQVRRPFEDESKKEKTPWQPSFVIPDGAWQLIAAVAAAATSPWKTLVSGRGLTQR